MSSYTIAETHNLQTLLWAVAGAIYQAPTTLTRWSVWLAMVAQPIIADAYTLLAGLLTVLGWLLGITAIVGAVALLLANPAVLLAMLGIVGYGWLTYPRTAVRNAQ